MKKLVTALMIVLPILLVIAIFAVTGITRITAEIPVSGIVINNKGDGVFTFDLSDYKTPMYESDLGIEVLPYVASNKGYTLTVTDAQSGEPSDIVSVADDGKYLLNGIGAAKLTYSTNDGGYKDSVLFNIGSSGALDLTPILSDAAGDTVSLSVGEATDYAATVTSGDYTLSSLLYPQPTKPARLSYSSSNPDAIRIDEHSGEIKAYFECTATITATVYNSTGSAVTKTLRLTVKKPAESTVNGVSLANLRVARNAEDAIAYIDAPQGTRAEDIQADSEYIDSFKVTALPRVSQTAFALRLNFKKQHPQSVRIQLETGSASSHFNVDFADYEFRIFSPYDANGTGEIIMLQGEKITLRISSSPKSSRLTYKWSLSSAVSDIATITEQENAHCTFDAKHTGKAHLSVTVTEHDESGAEIAQYSVARDVLVTKRYTSMLFFENANSYGLSNIPAIARYVYNGAVKTEQPYKAGFALYNNTDRYSPMYEDIVFESSDESIADVEHTISGVYIRIKGTGRVTVTARWKYGDYFNVPATTFTFDAVDGVSVSDYAQLKKATADNERIVLDADIYLGQNLFDTDKNGVRTPKYDDATMRALLLDCTQEIKTTWDWTYYKNMEEEHPSIRYCVEFTNDVYGNGHFINGEYITNMYDATSNLFDFAVFRGPLDFVSTSIDGIKVAAVKGQDNIVFLVRKDGISINNTVLKGCDDESLFDNGEINLSLLNETGTTLEIMSDATLNFCRVMNGRNTVRAYGRDGIDQSSKVNAQSEKINVTLNCCILQNAREFLLKIGTNRALREQNTTSPLFKTANGRYYRTYNSPETDSLANDDYFASNYILTYVTVKDSLLRTSGLFTIGVESHFSGPMLAGGKGLISAFRLPGWNDLAATSYPAMLKLVGDVVLADWKNLASLDSSTLIETAPSNTSALSFLSLDISQMLKCVQRSNPAQYKDIIANVGGQEKVHGGIAFYGGGKNYSVLDMSDYTFEPMRQYVVNLRALTTADDINLKRQGELLPLAAGSEDFRFVMFDASGKFDFNAQQKLTA